MPASKARTHRRASVATLLALGLILSGSSSRAGATCAGDCDNSNAVSLEELTVVLNLGLTSASSLPCSDADMDLDGKVTVDEVVATVRAASAGCPPPPEPIFPADYRLSFIEVRSCRIGNEHDGHAIRVLANPIAAAAYLAEQNPLPPGSIVVKEEFEGTSCSDGNNLARWSVMRKETAGFDSVDGDWHWQRLRTDGSLFIDGKATCVGCHRVPACRSRDYMCTEPLLPATPSLVFEELPATLWAIAGTSPSDVYAVGGDPASDDFGPYVLSYDGTRWVRLRAPVTDVALRWISVAPIDGAFYMAGDDGVILQFDLTSRTFTRHVTPGGATLFGIWGTRADRLWAVGADPNSTSEDEAGVLWSYDGVAWKAEDLSALRPQGVPSLFKVWGRGEGEVYVVGQRGLILRYDGNTWTEIPSGTERPLFTVHGNSRDVVAVGGFGTGVIVEQAGAEFVDRTAPGANQLNGVFLPEEGGGVAVGNDGAYAARTRSGWEVQAPADTVFGFHAVWVDPEGGVWAAGGDLSTDLKHGLVAYTGSRTISGQIVDIDPCAFEAMSGPATVSFTEQIAPLFAQTGCMAAGCHVGPQNLAASRYSMSTRGGLFKQGVLAKALDLCPLVPGDPGASFLLEKLEPIQRQNAGVRMPTGSGSMPLSEDEIGLIRTWILEGAQDN